MRLQVEQLEKEKKGLAERLRFIAKRLDHTERAFRKEERPLLALDYERQQAEDRAAWEEAQKRALEEAKQAHRRNLETKRRLSRMVDDYRSRKDVYISSRGEEYASKKREAEKKEGDKVQNGLAHHAFPDAGPPGLSSSPSLQSQKGDTTVLAGESRQ